MINLIMNIILTLVNSVITFVVVSVTLVTMGSQDTNYWIGCALAFFSGFGLRLMGDIRNKKISWLNSFVQFVSSVCLCAAALVFKPSFATWMKLEYFMFFAALCSVWIIDLVERTFKSSVQIGFPAYARLLLAGIGKYLTDNAKRKEDDI